MITYNDIILKGQDAIYVPKLSNHFNISYFNAPIDLESEYSIANQIIYYIFLETLEHKNISKKIQEKLIDAIVLNWLSTYFKDITEEDFKKDKKYKDIKEIIKKFSNIKEIL